jgi:lipoate-protein ligase B
MRTEDWGLVEYELSVERQLQLVEEISEGGEERLVLCQHPPLVTLGRATSADDLIGWKGLTYESSRGGRATYHGPNQIVIYPILDLRRAQRGFPARDIHAYLRALEAGIVEGLHELGLSGAEARTTEVGGVSLTGVWVGERKLASIGIAVRKWTTYHGAAINILNDASAFQGIRPCGFAPGVMTSVEEVLHRSVAIEAAQAVFERVLSAGLV